MIERVRLWADPEAHTRELESAKQAALAAHGLDFAPSSEVVVRITSGPVGPEIPVSIAVGDTGLGIPAGKLQDIFHQFTQADSSTTRKHGGTGPGHLPAARQAHAR